LESNTVHHGLRECRHQSLLIDDCLTATALISGPERTADIATSPE
jgi:hypothetical protein